MRPPRAFTGAPERGEARSGTQPSCLIGVDAVERRTLGPAATELSNTARCSSVRLDEDTWLDILVWNDTAGAAATKDTLGQLPLVAQMHSLVSAVASINVALVRSTPIGPPGIFERTR